DLVPCRKEWTERRESIRALALESLPATVELEIALGKINADAIAEHVIERVALGNIDAGPADHHAQLDLPVDAFCLARHDQIVRRAAQRAARLEKQRRLFRQWQAGFLGVVAVVE